MSISATPNPTRCKWPIVPGPGLRSGQGGAKTYRRFGDGRYHRKKPMQIIQVVAKVKGIVQGILERRPLLVLALRAPACKDQEADEWDTAYNAVHGK